MKNAIHTVNTKLAIIFEQLAIFEKEIPKEAAKLIGDACLDITKALKPKSVNSLPNSSVFYCDDFDFEYQIDAPVGAEDVNVICKGWHDKGRLERLDIFYKGVEASGLVKITGEYEQILERAKELAHELAESVA